MRGSIIFCWMKSRCLENEMRMRDFSVDVGNLNIVEKGKDGRYVKKQLEIDLICNKGSKKYYIQSAYLLETEEKTDQ